MARSLRSKRLRKNKAIKRERYDKKVLSRLEDMLKKAKEEEESGSQDTMIPFKLVEPPTKSDSDRVEKMEEDVRVYDERTMKDQHGNYPEWMTKKRIQQLKRRKVGKVQKAALKKKALRRKGIKK